MNLPRLVVQVIAYSDEEGGKGAGGG